MKGSRVCAPPCAHAERYQDLPHPELHTVASEDALRRQMAQFFEASSDAIFFLNRDYVFTFLNKRAAEILFPSGQVLGTQVWQSFPEATRPDLPYWDAYHRTMDEGVISEFETYYPAPLNIELRVRAYPSDHGITIFFRDISDEKRAHRELQRKRQEAERQHAEIEAVYRTAPIGLALFDLDDFHYLRLNDRQAAFFGLKPEQVVGRTVMEMAPIPGLRELFEQVARGEPVTNYPLEGTLTTDPDNYRYWVVNYFPVYASDGTVQAITASSLEITQQKKAEQALIETDKLAAVGRLASSIAHEINNPLEAVTNLQYLAKISPTLEEARAHLEIAERELARVAAITTQTLRFHKQSTSPRAVRAERLVHSVLSIYQGRVVNSGVKVMIRTHDELPVRCFEGEIRQVISNLVGNALDAMCTGGKLMLRTRDGHNWATGEAGAVITVADSGPGMSPDVLGKAFRPFFTTKGATGTGLGLWISKEIVDRHRGSLSVRTCTADGRSGTVFALFLPYDAVVR